MLIMSYVNAPIHDLFIRIKNAYMARKTTVEGVVFSKFKVKVLELLKEYHFINDYQVVENGVKKTLTIHLHIVKDPINDIPEVKFYSKPSRPRYVGYKELHTVAGGKGIGIISTNQGLLPVHVAKQKKLGGELIAEIY
jgi:small subunit ribosomal protein S8